MKRLTYTIKGAFGEAFNLDMAGTEVELITYTYRRILYYFATDYRDVKVGISDCDLVTKWALEHSNTPLEIGIVIQEDSNSILSFIKF